MWGQWMFLYKCFMWFVVVVGLLRTWTIVKQCVIDHKAKFTIVLTGNHTHGWDRYFSAESKNRARMNNWAEIESTLPKNTWVKSTKVFCWKVTVCNKVHDVQSAKIADDRQQLMMSPMAVTVTVTYLCDNQKLGLS